MQARLPVFIGVGCGMILAFALLQASAHAAVREPVYKGRAVFEELRPARIPRSFIGNWSQINSRCNAKLTADWLRINPTAIAFPRAKLNVYKIFLNPSQHPNYNHAIVEFDKGGTEPPALILHLESNGALTVRFRDGSRQSRYKRCA